MEKEDGELDRPARATAPRLGVEVLPVPKAPSRSSRKLRRGLELPDRMEGGGDSRGS